MRIQKHWNAFTFIIMALGALWIGLTMLLVPAGSGGMAPAPRSGFLAPDFELISTEGNTVRLSDLHGSVVIVNIWASWCSPCQAEMPALQSVYEKFSDKGLVILAVNSTIQDDPISAQGFAKEKGLTFPVLLDSSGIVTKQYQVRALPTTFFIDHQGVIRDFALGGPLSEAYLISQVETLIAGGQ